MKQPKHFSVNKWTNLNPHNVNNKNKGINDIGDNTDSKCTDLNERSQAQVAICCMIPLT